MIFPQLQIYIEASLRMFEQITDRRRSRLDVLTRYVEQCVAAEARARLTFICTHNSRRSQMAQIWAQTAAAWFRIPKVETYSGGTETTAFEPRAVAAMKRAGFRITATDESSNTVYRVQFDRDAPTMEAYSKVFSEDPNPTSKFCAVMTCASADRNCPLVPGVDLRVAIPYDDPKESDGTDQETAAYDERCRQISFEMLHLFSRVKKPASTEDA
jgi:protein-tyrosine-phosphatase